MTEHPASGGIWIRPGEWLTLDAVSKALDIGAATCSRLFANECLPGIKAGRSYSIPSDFVIAVIRAAMIRPVDLETFRSEWAAPESGDAPVRPVAA